MLPFDEISDTLLVPYTEIEDMEFAVKNGVLYTVIDDEVVIGISKVDPQSSLNYISHISGRYRVVLLDSESYQELLAKFKDLNSNKTMEEFSSEDENDDEESFDSFLKNDDDLLSSENSAPIIQFVNTLFMKAVKQNCTDIHIETYEKEGLVKFRIDGVLLEIASVKKSVIQAIVNRVKVISNLDISETRIPQDGRTKISLGQKQVDIRVSILPTYYGEKVVMRLLMKSDSIPTLEELGFSEHITKNMKDFLKHSYGMILITGPTGSGKSTTLYSFLQNIDHSKKNIVTVEDPVEYNSFGINQVQVNDKVGLTFAKSLRSILRQDPDVILLGEIRDSETAAISVQAAMTGHLLLSTLHTNTAAAAISRLVDMGVDSYLIGSTLLGVLAQRLVRKLCVNCREQIVISDEDSKFFGVKQGTKINQASTGCKECNQSGYKGRIAIGEIITIDAELLKVIKSNSDEFFIKEHLASTDFISMQAQLRDMIASGETSVEEAIRIGIKEL
ncbi:MAG: type II/IV secretion system protein [Sulfurimonas sp.]|nr:type II/IV secretion system protein [Sulfurimonas sp.]